MENLKSVMVALINEYWPWGACFAAGLVVGMLL
jgi:hypothetical protein